MEKNREYSPVKINKRKCLRCAKMFNSTGPGNRICDDCNKVNKHKRETVIPNELYHIRNKFYEIL